MRSGIFPILLESIEISCVLGLQLFELCLEILYVRLSLLKKFLIGGGFLPLWLLPLAFSSVPFFL